MLVPKYGKHDDVDDADDDGDINVQFTLAQGLHITYIMKNDDVDDDGDIDVQFTLAQGLQITYIMKNDDVDDNDVNGRCLL